MAENPAKRQTAVKIRISDIKNSRYIKAEGDWEPNYLLTPFETSVSRVNLLGTVLDAEGTSFTIDDGTGQIVVRSFEEPQTRPEVGDVILVIGKPREFNNDKYVVPEIIKKIEKHQKEWIELRKLELARDYGPGSQPKEENIEQEPPSEQPTESVPSQEEVPVTEEPAESSKIFDVVVQTIKELDEGQGADMEEIVSKSGHDEQEVENVVNNLLMDGEAFEIKPGKLKLLD